MNPSRQVFYLSRVYGSRHGGSLYAEALVHALTQQGWTVDLLGEKFESFAVFPTPYVRTVFRWFFRPGLGLLPLRALDVIRLLRMVRARRPALVIVQGDLPRLTYLLLQRLVPMIFIRQDGILTCPANDRYLPLSRTVCRKPLGWSCLSMDRQEGCLCGMSKIKKMGRIAYRLRDHFLLRRLRHFVANSEYILRMHSMHGRVLYPPLLGEGRVMSATPRDRFRLVFCGRLDAVKNADEAIRILSQLPLQYRLDVLGDGADRARLEALCATLGINDRVVFHGWVNQRTRDQVFASCGALLMPSLWAEAFGMVGIEAFNQGTPVIAYEVGGVAEWCREPAGWLVPCGDIAAAAAMVISVTEDESFWKTCSGHAGQASGQKFSMALFCESAIQLVDQITCAK